VLTDRVHASKPSVSVVDRVGAGDAYAAGFLATLTGRGAQQAVTPRPRWPRLAHDLGDAR
jgi:sugar/nucleoside kinase (ribokinase family)